MTASVHQQVPCTRKKLISLGSRLIACCKIAPTLARQMWRHNYIIDHNEYLTFTLSESINPWVYSLLFSFKSTNNSWRCERKCEWVFYFWTQCICVCIILYECVLLNVGFMLDTADSACESPARSFSPDAQPFTPKTSIAALSSTVTDEPTVSGKTMPYILSPDAPEFVPKNFKPTLKVLNLHVFGAD